MYCNMTPQYLSSLVPTLVQNVSHYNLRNAENLQTVQSRTTHYCNSFLPSVIRDWNSMLCGDRDGDSTISFKRRLNQNRVFVPKYYMYYTGKRKPQILHTHAVLWISTCIQKTLLNHLYVHAVMVKLKMSIISFLRCPLYRDQRIDLNNTVSRYTALTFNVLLSGDETLPFASDVAIFESVQKCILVTKRFNKK